MVVVDTPWSPDRLRADMALSFRALEARYTELRGLEGEGLEREVYLTCVEAKLADKARLPWKKLTLLDTALKRAARAQAMLTEAPAGNRLPFVVALRETCSKVPPAFGQKKRVAELDAWLERWGGGHL